MNQDEQVLLQAVQKSLWNKDITFPENTDWNAVLQEAEDQAVLGIVFGVVPEEYQKEWKGRVSSITAHFVRILHYQEQLYKLLKDNGIPMVILKGTAAAVYYPNPSQRTMGDVDFIVPTMCFDEAKSLLGRNEYEITENEGYLRHIHAAYNGVSFEMHRFFSDGDFNIDAFISDAMKNSQEVSLYGSRFSMLPQLENGLVLLTHIIHHIRTGIGIRQIIDWMMFVNHEHDNEFWRSVFLPTVQSIGLEQFAISVTRTCQLYLGLPEEYSWCENVDDEICANLMSEALKSGNFGHKNPQALRFETVFSGFRKDGFFRYLQNSGEYNWQAYHRHKWLKPFAWIYQIGRYAKQGLQTKRNTKLIKEDFERGKQRNDLLEKLKLGE